MDHTLPSICPICIQIPNHSHGNLLPDSSEHLPDAVNQLKQDGKDFSPPDSTGEWALQCPSCGCCYLLSSETGAFEYDVYVTRLTPIGAWRRNQLDAATCRQLLNAMPADLYHDSPEFRSYAAASLAQLYQEPDAPNSDALCALLHSPDEVVRSAALHEIPAAGAEPFAEALADLLWDPSWQIHEAVLYRLCPSRDPQQAARNIGACFGKLEATISSRPLTFNVIQLLTELEPLPLEKGLAPFLPRLISALQAGELDGLCAKDALKLLSQFARHSTGNAAALLTALDGATGAPLPPKLVELRALAAEGSVEKAE